MYLSLLNYMPMNTTTPLTRRVVSHWGRPRGSIGRLAGWEMSHGKEATNRLVTELLGVERGDRVVEVGFGPGVTVAHLAGLVGNGLVAGVDHSDVMLAQAVRRNRTAAAAGRVDLRLATAERLPFDDNRFTKALTLNSIGFWEDVEAGLRELHRVLAPGGRLLVGMRRGRERADDVAALLERAGFDAPVVEEHATARLTSIVTLRR
jgi:SAM-dependent methyltransferase